jgi:hypothetical protein
MSAPAYEPEARAPEAWQAGSVVVVVRVVADDGRTWSAIGGGAGIREAVDFARASCPEGPTWRVSGWDDVYGA